MVLSSILLQYGGALVRYEKDLFDLIDQYNNENDPKVRKDLAKRIGILREKSDRRAQKLYTKLGQSGGADSEGIILLKKDLDKLKSDLKDQENKINKRIKYNYDILNALIEDKKVKDSRDLQKYIDEKNIIIKEISKKEQELKQLQSEEFKANLKRTGDKLSEGAKTVGKGLGIGLAGVAGVPLGVASLGVGAAVGTVGALGYAGKLGADFASKKIKEQIEASKAKPFDWETVNTNSLPRRNAVTKSMMYEPKVTPSDSMSSSINPTGNSEIGNNPRTGILSETIKSNTDNPRPSESTASTASRKPSISETLKNFGRRISNPSSLFSFKSKSESIDPNDAKGSTAPPSRSGSFSSISSTDSTSPYKY